MYDDCSCAAPKGTMSRDLRPSFFHDSYPHGPVIHMLKYFRIWYRFRGRYSHVQKTQGVTTAMGVRLRNVNDSMLSQKQLCGVFQSFFSSNLESFSHNFLYFFLIKTYLDLYDSLAKSFL